MAKLQESKGRYSIVIPKEMVKLKEWVKGQDLVIVFNERGSLEICDSLKKK
jgi:hypothetical protein